MGDPEEKKRFFSHARRDFIARAVMDIIKLLFVGGVVGGFFVVAPMVPRVIGLLALLAGSVVAVLTFPRKKEDD